MIDNSMKKDNIKELIESIDIKASGLEMYRLLSELYPICRSITGNGVRETLSKISSIISLEVHEVPSGMRVFDWIVPKEWNIRDACIKNSKGEKIVDFKKSNLHVLNYSLPIQNNIYFGIGPESS